MTRTLRLLAALAMVAVIGAGCSKAPAHTATGSGSRSAEALGLLGSWAATLELEEQARATDEARRP